MCIRDRKGDDESSVALFRRICADVQERDEGLSNDEPKGMQEKMLSLLALISWLESYMGVGLGCEMPTELLMDQIMLELSVIGRFTGGGDTDRGGVREPVCQPDEEEEALRCALPRGSCTDGPAGMKIRLVRIVVVAS